MAIPAMVIHLTGGRSGRGDRVIALAGYQGHGQRQDEEDHGNSNPPTGSREELVSQVGQKAYKKQLARCLLALRTTKLWI